MSLQLLSFPSKLLQRTAGTLVKGTIPPDKVCLKVVWFNRPRLGDVMLIIKKFLLSALFSMAFEVSM